MQDGGKRKRSDVCDITLTSNSKSENKSINKIENRK